MSAPGKEMSWDWDKLKDQQDRKSPKNVPPQFDDFFDQFKKIKIPGGSIWLLALLAAVFLGATMVYTIGVDEVGVVQRFGKYVRTSQPGLNFKMPVGIENVSKVKIRRVYKEEFGFRSAGPDSRGRILPAEDPNSVSLMLTGDLNVAVVPWIVQYRVKDPYNFLFKVQDVKRLLIDLSESSMRLVVGDRSINEVISKREEIAVEARQKLQEELDKAESGVSIVTIEMKKTNVPAPVQPSFNEVNQATQEKERLIYEAREDYNKAIPAALGEAERTIRAAEGFSLDRINRAEGDAARFRALYAEYSKAQDITRRRLYLEMIQEVFPKLGDKYVIDKENSGILPLLNIGRQGGDQ